MAAGYRSNTGSARRAFSRRIQLPFAVFLFFVLIPTIAIFCHNWKAADSLQPGGKRSTPGNTALSSRVEHDSPGAWIGAFIKTIPNPGRMEFVGHKPDDPFRTNLSREIISAKGDPFQAALALGVSEGVLVVIEKTNGVTTLGPQLPKNTRTRFSDLEILKEIQSGVGGSFNSFYSNLFGNVQRDSALAAASLQENPFSKAMESLTAGDKQNTSSDVKSDTSQTNKDPSGQHTSPPKESPTTGPAPVASSSEPRPHLLLSVGDDGTLHSVPVSQPQPGVFQAPEIGVLDLPLLRLADTADLFGSIAVADFNGDGYPDVAYFVPMQGLVRFFYGASDGSFSEGLHINIGNAERVLAAGDFNHDGQMDLAFSTIGSEIVTILFKDGDSYRFKSFDVGQYPDYIQAADADGSGYLDLLGLDFANSGAILIDFSQPDGTISGKTFNYQPSLNTQLSTSQGWSPRLNAVVLGSSLSLNVDNQQSQLMHVLNVLSGTKIYVIVGDLFGDGRLVLGFAIPNP